MAELRTPQVPLTLHDHARRSRPQRRAARWDAGPVLTVRDVLALRWLGEQYAATSDTLGVLLGRLSPAAPQAPGQVAGRTVRHHLDRWVRAGLATRTRRLGRTWVTPTRRGLDLVELGYPTWALPATQLAHVHAVGLVRLAREPDPCAGGWVTERALSRERGKASWHLADGALPAPVPPGWAAQGITDAFERVEVELTPKPRRRLAAALRTQAPGAGAAGRPTTPAGAAAAARSTPTSSATGCPRAAHPRPGWPRCGWRWRCWSPARSCWCPGWPARGCCGRPAGGPGRSPPARPPPSSRWWCSRAGRSRRWRCTSPATWPCSTSSAGRSCTPPCRASSSSPSSPCRSRRGCCSPPSTSSGGPGRRSTPPRSAAPSAPPSGAPTPPSPGPPAPATTIGAPPRSARRWTATSAGRAGAAWWSSPPGCRPARG